MASGSTVTIGVRPDVSDVVRFCRIVAKHLTALADELEAPENLVRFSEQLSAEDVERIKAELAAGFTKGGA